MNMHLTGDQWALISLHIPAPFSVFSALSVAKPLLIDKSFKGQTPHVPEVSWSQVTPEGLELNPHVLFVGACDCIPHVLCGAND